LRPIRACAQCRGKFLDEALDAILLDRRQSRTIDSGGAAVPFHPPPCFPQDVTPVDPIQERMEAAFRGSLGRDPEASL
jgi:hypothetical protein